MNKTQKIKEEWMQENINNFSLAKDEELAVLDWFLDRCVPKEELEEAFKENLRETMWGSKSDNEVMKISIENFITAVWDFLNNKQ